MKFATLRTDQPDGRLLLVSRNLKHCAPADDIVPNLREALERWNEVAPQLETLYEALNAGSVADAVAFDPAAMAAPLPRTWQWLDGSAYPSHGELMRKAFDLPAIETDTILMYQGMSHQFLSGREDILFPSEADGIDFEGELGVITGEVPMGASPTGSLAAIRLVVQINDWSLRMLAPAEMKTGFGWIQAKPACSMAPVAVTPDELNDAWRDGRVDGELRVWLNGTLFGAVPTRQMEVGFHELVCHAARTRRLCAGTIIGSGTVSSPDYRRTGSCCIAERRAVEAMEQGAASTAFLQDGDRVVMEVYIAERSSPVFSSLDQAILSVPAGK